MDEQDIDKIQKHAKDVCVPWTTWNRVIWAAAIVALGMLGSATGYAIATSVSIAEVKTTQGVHETEINTMKAKWDQVDRKLDVLLQRVK